MVSLINVLMLWFIDLIGRLQRFSRFSLHQAYVIRVAFVYLLVNMLIIPGLSVDTSNSVFTLIFTNTLNLN